MDELYWKEKWSKLDIERECSASEKSCWLCDDLESWNSVLNYLQLDLTEWQVGKLQLRTQAGHPSANMEKWNTLYTGTFFLTWLPRKHRCIEAISLGPGYRYPYVTPHPDSITRGASNLRHITITGDMPFDWALVLDALCPIQQLETLQVKNEVKLGKRLALTLAQIVTASCHSVKTVVVSQIKTTSVASNILMSAISKCDALQKLALSLGLHPAGLRDLVMLLRSTQTLHTLRLVREILSDSCCMESDEDNAPLRKNPRLTALNHQLLENTDRKVLLELENNCTVTCLVISGWDMGPMPIGILLKSVLSKNYSLRSLILKHCYIDNIGTRQLSDGLRENKTLDCLDISTCHVRCSTVQFLRSALKQNKSLRLLKFSNYVPLRGEREALSVELAENQWHGRLQLRWTDTDIPGLISALSEPSMCPAELELHADEFSDKSFAAICSALASSHCVKALTVYMWNDKSAHITSLRQMLEENEHLRSLTLHYGYTIPGFAARALQALLLNERLNDLTLVCPEMGFKSAEMLATLLKTNKNLHRLVLLCKPGLTRESLDVISQGLLQNIFITDVSVGCITPAIRLAVQRNVSFLHCAASFVLGHNIEKLCAEAFELLESKASLISYLKSASGMTETEARAAVLAARKFIWSNYFFINQIVSRKIECYAREGTQIDKLNFECLLAIAKHLKICDVRNREC